MPSSDSTLPKPVSVFPVDLPKQDACCVSPCDPPWRKDPACLIFYQTVQENSNLDGGSAVAGVDPRGEIQIQVIYEHKLCLIGKQHGSLAKPAHI